MPRMTMGAFGGLKVPPSRTGGAVVGPGRFLYRRTLCAAVQEPTAVSSPSPAEAGVGEERSTQVVAAAAANVKENWEDLIRSDSGPTFFVPSNSDGGTNVAAETLPILIYLPGLDGTGITGLRQFPNLADAFDLRALVLPFSDRTSFHELVDIVKDYVEEIAHQDAGGRPVYLAGESFGALLALIVAHHCKNTVDRLVLINPATSLEDAFVSILAQVIPSLPGDAGPFLPAAMAPVFGNPLRIISRGLDFSVGPDGLVAQFFKVFGEMLGILGIFGDALEPRRLEWVIQQTQEGIKLFDKVGFNILQRCLLIVGEDDQLLPSGKQASKLQEILQRCQVKVIPEGSHMLLQEAGIDLVKIIKEEGFYVQSRRLSGRPDENGAPSRSLNNFGSAKGPIELPTPTELERTIAALNSVFSNSSPVYFSTMDDGSIVQGFAGVPKDGPVIFVGNHQTLGFDTFIFVGDLLRSTDMLVRGLAHPFMSQVKRPQDLEGLNLGPLLPGGADLPLVQKLVTTFGGVPVTGKSFFQLLRRGENVLLYPGGVREAYKMKDEKYQLFWPERAEFVRMAARFGATIVPLAAVGLEDSVEIIVDANDLSNIPILNTYIDEQLEKYVPKARTGVSAEVGTEGKLISPITLPRVPQRIYFLMQKPIKLTTDDYADREKCHEIYCQVKDAVEGGISYLQEKRQEDPYKDLFLRGIYEMSSGGKPAPTFKP